ncbi:probable hydrolase [Pseudooceanicola batsensis HTCC2597]|uniref:Probable hydrolase n=1 Tax=Pseudooceanicola batsensis (strain ATCC BAA-863 / DSM 15984 / KCTC 12145 / HTCC2597) TaxID=252305 RepID=A3TT13_PSEBH|nr:alpha/beta hydrolase [Pseudooceanicola batsensis]EAQ04790.1 probable hydrolase [Pseudooceanicola batsensis HTCC2597]
MSTAQVNGIEIWYEELGPEDGKPILMISGVGTQSTRWKADFVDLLVARGYRVIKMDNRDIGLSQKFTDHGLPDFKRVIADKAAGKTPDIPYTLSDMAADGAALLDHLGIDKAHVCGFSMGGMIVQLMAIEHPDKVLSMSSVMSNSGNPDLPKPTDAAMAALTRPRPDALKDRDAFINSRIETDHVIGSPAYPIPDEDLRAQAEADLDRSYHPTGFARQYAAILATRDRRAELRNLTMPVAVIHGTDDPLVPVTGGRDTAENCPTADLIEIPGMGHNFPHEVYEAVLDGIEKATLRA